MDNLPKVLVLLSTYNGEKYLKEQLDSIYNQLGVEVSIFVSDDISNDKTVEILKEYESSHGLKFRVNDHNKNFTYNFLDLIYDSANENYDYFALADQDDFWMEDKLISAINLLNEKHKHFYCSNLSVVDEKLANPKPMNKFKEKNKYHAHFLLENICTGCTTVFDKEFISHLNKYYPKDIYLHDYWLFLVASFTSSFVYDPTPHILYRQHGNNQIGSDKGSLSAYYKKFSNGKTFRHHLFEELLNGFGDEISDVDKKYLNQFLKYKKSFAAKLAIFFSPKWHTHRYALMRKIKILFNKY